MTSGTAGNETPNFDANGNERGTTINGGTWVDNYDDEDRLTSVAVPSGPTDTFTYNGLGLRVGKTDSTGTYSYVCDGTSPGSPILSDGQAIYTPGLSERRNGVSLFYNSDDLGNLWTAEDGTGKAEAGAYLFTGFGVSLYAGAGAASASPLKYGGANGCQTDVDTGLVMMGCRYYDTRTGRFISQDPIGDGDNWYAYAGNSPTNTVDPMGLDQAPPGIDQATWDQEADVRAENVAEQEEYLSEQFPNDTIEYDSDGSPYVQDGSMTVYAAEDDGDSNAGMAQSVDDMTGDGGKTDSDTGFGGWVDSNLTFGLVAAAGRDWDSNPTKAHWEASGAAALVVGTAITLGRGTTAASGLRALKVTYGMLGRNPHFWYSVGDTVVHGMGPSGEMFTEQASESMMRLLRPKFSIYVPIFFPNAALRVGLPVENCFYAAAGAVRAGIFGK